MARSGSVDFTVNALQIASGAFRIITHDEDPPVGKQANDLVESLNMMVKTLMGSPDVDTTGLKMWQRTRATLLLDSADISFELKAADGDLDIDPPVSILSAMLKTVDNEETVLTTMLVEEFEAIPNKSDEATGKPTKYYYEREFDKGVFYIDRIPDILTDVVDLVYLRPLQDIDSATDDLDFPQHWFNPLKWMLAIENAEEYGAPVTRNMENRAAYWLAKAQSFYPEHAPEDAYFQPGRDD